MEQALHIGSRILYVVMIFGGLLYIPRLIFLFYGLKKQKPLPTAEMKNKYAVLIPARNESRVIEALLKSIDAQTYPRSLLDVYVMVTDENDPTCEICKRYNVKRVVVVPPDLNSKGKTLDICLKKILEENADEYKAHFVFDADNVLSPAFIEKMNNVYAQGYKLAMGRRTNKSWSQSWVSNCSFLTFTYVNSLNNKFRTRAGGSITISGSGFYVANDLVKEWGGWPFHSITEDYELSRYACINDIKGYYCECATVADEQPTKMKASKTQRLRWIKGHNMVDRAQNGKLFKQVTSFKTKNWFIKADYLFSLVPVIIILVGLVVFFLYSLSFLVVALVMKSPVWAIALGYTVKTAMALYALLLIYTTLGIVADIDIIHTNLWQSTLLFFGFPFFMISWVPLYVKSFFIKKVEWKPTEHKLNVN